MINKDDISTQLNSMFRQRRENAKLLAEQNLNDALKDKDVNKYFYTVRSLQIDLSRAKDKKTIEDITNKIESARTELRKALANTKYTKQDFLPNYKCKICNDTGVSNGKICKCYKSEQNKMYLTASGISKDQLHSFKSTKFDIFDNPEEKAGLYNLAKDFVTKDSKKVNFVICGPTGVGKTYLTECMLNEAIDNSIYTIYTTAFKLNDTMLKYHLASIESKRYILEPYLTCDMLIIDDLGSENKLNNVTAEYLYLILETRARDNLKTIITTNLTPTQIQDKYDDRVFSRMFNKIIGVVISMQGEDLRFKK